MSTIQKLNDKKTQFLLNGKNLNGQFTKEDTQKNDKHMKAMKKRKLKPQ